MNDVWLTLDAPLQVIEQRAYYPDFFESWRDVITEDDLVVQPTVCVRVWPPIWMWGVIGGLCLTFPTSRKEVNGQPCLLSCFLPMSPIEKDLHIKSGKAPFSVSQFVCVKKAIGHLRCPDAGLVSIVFDVTENFASGNEGAA